MAVLVKFLKNNQWKYLYHTDTKEMESRNKIKMR